MPTLTLAHSPDPDDAFMWWPLGDEATGRDPVFDTGPFRFRMVTADIEALNRRAVEQGDLDITAISFHAYAHAAGRYALTSCGSSMGENYGPKVVALPGVLTRGQADALDALRRGDIEIAVPGERTTAFLTLRLLLGAPFRYRVMHFREIVDAVACGQCGMGLVIHEAQLTYTDSGLALVVDLGEWWGRETGLPLPLGANAIRHDVDERFGAGSSRRIAALLTESIRRAQAMRTQAVDHAMSYAGGVDRPRTDKFISMYVNDLSLDMGDRGERAVRELFARAAAAGLLPPVDGGIRVVRP